MATKRVKRTICANAEIAREVHSRAHRVRKGKRWRVSFPAHSRASRVTHGIDHEDAPIECEEDLLQLAVTEERAELAAGDGEDDRVEDVRDHLVKLVHVVQHLGRHGALVLVHIEAHDDDGDDGRGADDELTQPEAKVGHADDDRPLDEAIVVHEAQHEARREAKEEAEDDAKEEHLAHDDDEVEADVRGLEVVLAADIRRHPSGRNGRPVVTDGTAHPYV